MAALQHQRSVPKRFCNPPKHSGRRLERNGVCPIGCGRVGLARSRARSQDGVKWLECVKNYPSKMHRDGGFSDPPSVQARADDDRGTHLESWKEIADYLRRGRDDSAALG